MNILCRTPVEHKNRLGKLSELKSGKSWERCRTSGDPRPHLLRLGPMSSWDQNGIFLGHFYRFIPYLTWSRDRVSFGFQKHIFFVCHLLCPKTLLVYLKNNLMTKSKSYMQNKILHLKRPKFMKI